MANPPSEFIFRKFANGIRDVSSGKFYPYRVKTLTNGEKVTRKPNVRFYVDSVGFSMASLAADAGTSLTVTGTQYRETVTVAELRKTTLIAQQSDHNYQVGILLDDESEIAFTAADVTTACALVRYCEVDTYAGD